MSNQQLKKALAAIQEARYVAAYTASVTDPLWTTLYAAELIVRERMRHEDAIAAVCGVAVNPDGPMVDTMRKACED